MTTIKSLKRRINPNLKVKGILLTMYQSNTNQSKLTVESVKCEYGNLVFQTLIPYSTKVADAQRIGKSVIELDKNNPVSKAYIEFVEELLNE
jgi:chromosome partitioning protein